MRTQHYPSLVITLSSLAADTVTATYLDPDYCECNWRLCCLPLLAAAPQDTLEGQDALQRSMQYDGESCSGMKEGAKFRHSCANLHFAPSLLLHGCSANHAIQDYKPSPSAQIPRLVDILLQSFLLTFTVGQTPLLPRTVSSAFRGKEDATFHNALKIAGIYRPKQSAQIVGLSGRGKKLTSVFTTPLFLKQGSTSSVIEAPISCTAGKE